MAIWNLGSINIDHFYAVPHIPAPGETLAATGYDTGLGGKGANMAVASARAGSVTHLIAATGPDGRWARDRVMEYGVDTRFVAQVQSPTGHALISIAADGENAITLFAGANHQIEAKDISRALSQAQTGDWLLMQNETMLQRDAAQLAKTLGLKVAYAAAPFDAEATKSVLPFLDFLILNEVEASQLETSLNRRLETFEIPDIIVTLGANGAKHITPLGARSYPAIPVEPVDTTGAGDTFTGYVLSGLDRGLSMPQSIRLASFAAALMVTRHGTADVIPDLSEVQAMMGA